MQNSINIQFHRNQTFTVNDSFERSFKICTDDYGNNEYLAVKYIRFSTNNSI